MRCEECGQRPASVHITKIVNNEKSERHLCDECARVYQEGLNVMGGLGIDPGFSLHKFLASLLSHEPGHHIGPGRMVEKAALCPGCGLTYDQFKETGRLGCEACYQSFSGQLMPLVRRLHGSAKHAGKVPGRAAGWLRLKQDIERMRQQLQEAVSREEFEKAAQLRDRIRELEKQSNETGEA